MAKTDGLSNSPFEQPACPTPSAGESSVAGLRGGYDWTDMPKETANQSELGPSIITMDVKDGPARDSTVKVEPGVASPAVAAANIDQKGV